MSSYPTAHFTRYPGFSRISNSVSGFLWTSCIWPCTKAGYPANFEPYFVLLNYLKFLLPILGDCENTCMCCSRNSLNVDMEPRLY